MALLTRSFRSRQYSKSIVSCEQNNPVPAVNGLYNLLQTEEPRTDDIVLEERTKLIKQEAKAENKIQEPLIPKKESTYSSCAQRASRKGKKMCDCLDVECAHMNFQECFPLAWEDVYQQQQAYHKYTWDHYGIAPIETPPMSPASRQAGGKDTSNSEQDDLEASAPFLPSPSSDKRLTQVKEEKESNFGDEDEEDMQERAPFIPPPFTDSGLMCDDEMLADVAIGDTSCWLDGSALKTSYITPGKIKKPPQSLSARSSPVSLRKIPESIRRNGYITNDLGNNQVYLPSVTQVDAEMNAPVQSCNLLQGAELLTALDVDMMDINSM